MSEAAPDRDAEMLARVAELDLAAAEHVHAKLMQAEDADAIADLGRTYQRLSRSLRQTVMLKAKMAREAAQHAAWLKAREWPEPGPGPIATRIDELQDAVGRIAAAAVPDPAARAEVLDRLDRELDEWVEAADFDDADLDAQVREACEFLELPEALAATWRDLPRPDDTPDPAARPRDDLGDAFDAPPLTDTG